MAPKKTSKNTVSAIMMERNMLFRIVKETISGEDCPAKFTALKDQSERLFKKDEEILLALRDGDIPEAELMEEIRRQEDARKCITQALSLESTCVSNVVQSHNVNIKLPNITLTEYDLNANNWLVFWAQYGRIFNNVNLSYHDKYMYLLNSLKGRSRLIVEAYTPSEQNLNNAIEHLKNRYGTNEIQIEVQIRNILSLVLEKRQDLTFLYDRLNTYLNSLSTLGFISGTYESFIYPLVESSLPIETLKGWHRHILLMEGNPYGSRSSLAPELNQLQRLMKFLEAEIIGNEKIQIAQRSFSNKSKLSDNDAKATASALVTTSSEKCIFCPFQHRSSDCRKAVKMSLEERKQAVFKNRCCFTCFKRGHNARLCRSKITCSYCQGTHYDMMCPEKHKSCPVNSDGEFHKDDSNSHSKKVFPGPIMLQNFTQQFVYLKTLLVKICTHDKVVIVRALIDDGSHRSYITTSLAKTLNIKSTGEEHLSHGLFGGLETKSARHCRYNISIKGMSKCSKLVHISVLNNDIICGPLPRIDDPSLLEELKGRNINLYDVLPYADNAPLNIDVLIGADCLGKLLTGKIEIFKTGFSAIETVLGWSVLGSRPKHVKTMVTLNLFSKDSRISQLWNLENLGISDPIEKVSNDLLEKETMIHFEKNVKRYTDGRYEVKLPWLDGHPPLADNRENAMARLISTTKRLKEKGLFLDYNDVFTRWECDGIVEEVPKSNSNTIYYLPHRPVIREGKSTKIRPIFDPSTKRTGQTCLNECLSAGPNLTQVILKLLISFRTKKYGLTADIRQAFQMISLNESDRDSLRFLWWNNNDFNNVRELRHCRVPFGVTSSPFLLSATLKHHLENTDGDRKHLNILKKSFYVDDLITSFHSQDEIDVFKSHAQNILGKAGFELRDWTQNNYEGYDSTHSVLGIKWHLNSDSLSIVVPDFSTNKFNSKRDLLSLVSKIYDPIGFLSASIVSPKMLLQEAWKLKLNWDQPLPIELKDKLKKWLHYFNYIKNVLVPRQIVPSGCRELSLHVFCDGSSYAYGACVFLRCVVDNYVVVRFVIAKGKIAPIGKNTIPRLELLGACIGVRMAIAAKNALEMPDIKMYYYTDSRVVLCWITKNEPWNTFVGNRVQEICKYTQSKEWAHIPGELNTHADLISRGCDFKTFVQMKWWEGPSFLMKSEAYWPRSQLSGFAEEALLERRKTVVTLNILDRSECFIASVCDRFSDYDRFIRVFSYVYRFCHNLRPCNEKIIGFLSSEEILTTERKVLGLVQMEGTEKSNVIKHLRLFDDNGILRLKTKLINGLDCELFKMPYFVPDHNIVKLIVLDAHKRTGHSGSQATISYLRERFWIHKARKVTRSVISRCVICKRYKSKAAVAEASSLPLDRVNHNCSPFEVTGVDLAGPLYLKDGSKVWIVVFTCAIYRAIHLELVSSLSANTFVQALRRFISRRGRCKIMYSDNGSNFTSLSKSLNLLDWNKVKSNTVPKIIWKFSVPNAPWWTGFIERLVGVVKSILKKVLSNALLCYEELVTVLCECESYVNNRPLTYIYNDPDELIPLTPAHFIQGIPSCEVTDLDLIKGPNYVKRYRYLQKVRLHLKERFRKEYLAELVKYPEVEKCRYKLAVGDVVLVGSDDVKRQAWPLARILELFPGKDGVERKAHLQLSTGKLYRPIQRLYPLEVRANELPIPSTVIEKETVKTKCDERQQIRQSSFGRKIKVPFKLSL